MKQDDRCRKHARGPLWRMGKRGIETGSKRVSKLSQTDTASWRAYFRRRK
jgi:hypothetical protein